MKYSLPVDYDETDRICVSVAKGIRPFVTLANHPLAKPDLWQNAADYQAFMKEITRIDREMIDPSLSPCT